MNDQQLAESVISGLVGHFEFTCYCGRDHYAGDGYVSGQCCDSKETWDYDRECECGRKWRLYGPLTWNKWHLVDKAYRVRNLFGKRHRAVDDVMPRRPFER